MIDRRDYYREYHKKNSEKRKRQMIDRYYAKGGYRGQKIAWLEKIKKKEM